MEIKRPLTQFRINLFNMMSVRKIALLCAYHNHCFSMLLQKYACYILSFDPAELHVLIEALVGEPNMCTLIISRLFTDTIFVQHILWQHEQTIHDMPHLITHFNDEATNASLCQFKRHSFYQSKAITCILYIKDQTA